MSAQAGHGAHASVEAAQLNEVAPGVYSYVQPDGTWFINNMGFIAGSNAVVSIDTTSTERRNRAYLDAIASVTSNPVKVVVNTHHHADHTHGNYQFTDATIISHARCRDVMVAAGIPDYSAVFPGVEWGDLQFRAPDVTFEGSMVLHLDDRRIELSDLGFVAHTDCDIVAWPPDSRVLRVPDSVSSPLASAATCALRTVMHALDRMPRIRFSASVVVLGAGPVGVLAAAAALRSGASQVILIGAPASRLAATEEWGLTSRIDIDHTEPDERIEAVRNMTQGRGADIVLECAGPPDAFTEGMGMVRAGGTLMVIGQAHGETVPVATTAMKVRQLTVRTSLSADISHFHDALRFLDRHSVELGLESAVCSTTYSLDQVTDALAAMRTGAEMKPVIAP